MAYHDHQGRGPTIGSEGYLPHPEGTTTETHHNELHHLPHLNDLFHNDNEGSNEANLTVNVDVGASCSPCSSTANAAAAAASSSSSSTVTDHTSGTDPVDVRIHAEDVCQAAMEGYDVMHSTAPTAATTTATATQTTAMTEGDGFVTAHQESSPASNKKRLLDGGSAASCNDSSNNPSAPNENINPNFNFNSDSNSNHPTMNNYGDDEDGESPVVQNNGHIDDEVERNENNTRNDETHYNKRARLSDVGGSGSGAEFESSSSSTTPSLLQQQHHHHGTEVFPHDSSEDLVGDGVATLSTEPNKKVNHEQWDTMFERLQVYVLYCCCCRFFCFAFVFIRSFVSLWLVIIMAVSWMGSTSTRHTATDLDTTNKELPQHDFLLFRATFVLSQFLTVTSYKQQHGGKQYTIHHIVLLGCFWFV